MTTSAHVTFKLHVSRFSYRNCVVMANVCLGEMVPIQKLDILCAEGFFDILLSVLNVACQLPYVVWGHINIMLSPCHYRCHRCRYQYCSHG